MLGKQFNSHRHNLDHKRDIDCWELPGDGDEDVMSMLAIDMPLVEPLHLLDIVLAIAASSNYSKSTLRTRSFSYLLIRTSQLRS